MSVVSEGADATTSAVASGAAPRAEGRRAKKTAPTAQTAAKAPKSILRTAVGGLRLVAIALVAAFLLRTLIVEPFRVPSGSMEPTLVAGDFIGAMKYAYGWSHVSASPLPLPHVAGRLFGSSAKHGDVVVFRNERDQNATYVKRVVGLPGDRVQMRGGILHVNGEAAKVALVNSFDSVDPAGKPARVYVFDETIPGGCPHRIQSYVHADGAEGGRGGDTEEVLVPAGKYFVLGDNRDASYDSRDVRVGLVPSEDVIGKAAFIFLSVEDDSALKSPDTGLNFRSDRTLKSLKCT
jgi:signal peptidase I